MPFRFPQGFSIFGGSYSADAKKVEPSKGHGTSPSLVLQTDRDIYRPGDLVTVTVEIRTPDISTSPKEWAEDSVSPFLVDNLAFEIKGVEKLDTQWFATQKLFSGLKMKRDLVRVELPQILPPSYRGTAIRYIYYIKSTLCGKWLAVENGHQSKGPTNNSVQVESRVPIQIWVVQKGNALLYESSQTDEFLLMPTIQIDAYWREKSTDLEWVRANDVSDGVEDGYDSLMDDVSSMSSYNLIKGVDMGFRNSFSLQSNMSRYSINEAQYSLGESSNFPAYPLLSQLSVAEITEESSGGILSPAKKLDSYSPTVLSPGHQKTVSGSPFSGDDMEGRGTPGNIEPPASEGFIRGRSYNIRIDDQILLRFSPGNSDSTYYFGDMIGGTLTFFHGEGARRCLEVAITLEVSETISHRFVHPSRRSSPTITKVQSDHHEVVADLVQTSFMFSIPMDGPMSFSTPYVSVKWALHFEFFTTPKYVDLSRYEHPLLIEDREKGDWVLPITVNAPPPRTQAAQVKTERSLSVGNLSLQT